MAPLLLCGFGLGFVLIRVRTHGIDVVPDSVGLGLYTFGLWRLASQSRMLVVASALSGIGALIAVLDFLSGVMSDELATAISFADSIAISLAIGVGSLGLRARARAAGDTDNHVAGQFRVVAGLVAIGLVVFVAGWIVNASDHGLALSMIGGGGLVSIVAIVWYVVLLVICAPRDWAQPETASAVVRAGENC